MIHDTIKGWLVGCEEKKKKKKLQATDLVIFLSELWDHIRPQTYIEKTEVEEQKHDTRWTI